MLLEMQKKEYAAPLVELEYFTIDDVIATSGGQGRYDDEVDEDTVSEENVDAYVLNTETGEVEAYLDADANEIDADMLDSIY